MLQILYGNTVCNHLPRLAKLSFTGVVCCTARMRIELDVFRVDAGEMCSSNSARIARHGPLAWPPHISRRRLQSLRVRHTDPPHASQESVNYDSLKIFSGAWRFTCWRCGFVFYRLSKVSARNICGRFNANVLPTIVHRVLQGQLGDVIIDVIAKAYDLEPGRTMIIWGWRGLTSTVSQQNFHCPRCNESRLGCVKQVRSWFTIYFIPLIPLSVQQRYLECSTCVSIYDEALLTHDPNRDQQSRITTMLRVMIMSALADGYVDDLERAEINKQFIALSGEPLNQNFLEQQIELAASSKNDLNGFATSFADDLTADGKALVVKLAFLVMSASTNFNQMHQQQLSQLPATLGITDQQFKALIKKFDRGGRP